MTTQFHLLSFEGPDPYSRAGGIATRISGLSEALAEAGFDTHLWFVGDPHLPGVEASGSLILHRWCQWISRYHPGGVYDGEEGKWSDLSRSLPPVLFHESLLPHLRSGGRGVILAEEWQTADAVLHLDWLLREHGLRQQVTILWNANNTFSFHRIDWQRLARAAVITTVSRYMKHLMRGLGVEALVIPNGLSGDALRPPERTAVAELRQRFRGRTVLSKVARWDPDKRWLLAVHTVGELKRQGWRPLLIARGGVEEHGAQVLQVAAATGLRVTERWSQKPGVAGLLQMLEGINGVDIVSLRSRLDPESGRVLYRACAAVLANSGHEPFGLVGLETMAAGGVACTGCSGEDYAVPGRNALVLETDNPRELVTLMEGLRADPCRERAIRRAGQLTARQYTWVEIIQRMLLPRLQLFGEVRSAHPA
jgi:glycosyltransferase involved in cell wall biosynthesis